MAKLIEFFGLPGCGKTTVVSALVNELRIEGCKLCTEDDIYDSSNMKRVVHLLRALFMPKNFRFNFQAFRVIVQVLGVKKIPTIMVRYMKLIKMNSQVNCHRSECTYIVLSEGYIQVLLSMFDDFEIQKADVDILKKILPCNEWVPVYLYVVTEVASDRIKDRKHDSDMWLEMSEMERKKRLLTREYNNELVAENLRIERMDGNMNTYKITSEWLKTIREKV